MGMRKELTIPDELFNLAIQEFECKWANNKVIIKRFTFGDQVQLQQDSMKVKANQQVNISADVNIADLQILTLMRAVVESPWGINDINSIRGLPPPIAEWLKEQVDEFNTIKFKKKEK